MSGRSEGTAHAHVCPVHRVHRGPRRGGCRRRGEQIPPRDPGGPRARRRAPPAAGGRNCAGGCSGSRLQGPGKLCEGHGNGATPGFLGRNGSKCGIWRPAGNTSLVSPAPSLHEVPECPAPRLRGQAKRLGESCSADATRQCVGSQTALQTQSERRGGPASYSAVAVSAGVTRLQGPGRTRHIPAKLELLLGEGTEIHACWPRSQAMVLPNSRVPPKELGAC